ncbi:DNA polymerase I, partial [candidate division KSB1 bacterium]|nr:DNA polymerase I [candidate division KSB1 bacterium]
MSSSKKKRLFLIDGAALAYRTYFAFARNPLVNSRGENVSVIFGVSRILLNLLEQEKPDYFAVVFDSPEPTFRHQLYEEYKAQRKEMPEDMSEQLPRVEQLFKALDIDLIRKPGFEADDIMGTLAKQAARQGMTTVLVTGDKDLMQLVDDSTVIYQPHRAGEQVEWLDAKGVEQKMGVKPEQIVDYLALCGDASDNIPGVPGIGPVGALSLLQQFGSLQKIIEQVDAISSKKYRNALTNHPDLAMLSQKLATIHCDVPLETEIERLAARSIPDDRAAAFFREVEIPSLVDRFTNRSEIKTDYHLLQTEDQFKAFMRELESVDAFAFDTETTDVDPMRAELVGLSFSWQPGTAYYIPLKGPQDMASQSTVLNAKMVLNSLRPLLANAGIAKYGHNAKYDMIVMSKHGIEMDGVGGDTMVASYLINPSSHQHNLDAVSLEHLNLKKIPTAQLLSSGKSQRTMDQVPVEQVAEYACEDADFTWRLAQILTKKITDLNLDKLYEEVELPLIHVLKRMEENGVALDERYLAGMSRELEVELAQIEKKITTIAGMRFNINSPKQLGSVLFETLKLPTARRTKTGFSTDVAVLEELAKQHELPRQILEYRQLAKLKST